MEVLHGINEGRATSRLQFLADVALVESNNIDNIDVSPASPNVLSSPITPVASRVSQDIGIQAGDCPNPVNLQSSSPSSSFLQLQLPSSPTNAASCSHCQPRCIVEVPSNHEYARQPRSDDFLYDTDDFDHSYAFPFATHTSGRQQLNNGDGMGDMDGILLGGEGTESRMEVSMRLNQRPGGSTATETSCSSSDEALNADADPFGDCGVLEDGLVHDFLAPLDGFHGDDLLIADMDDIASVDLDHLLVQLEQQQQQPDWTRPETSCDGLKLTNQSEIYHRCKCRVETTESVANAQRPSTSTQLERRRPCEQCPGTETDNITVDDPMSDTILVHEGLSIDTKRDTSRNIDISSHYPQSQSQDTRITDVESRTSPGVIFSEGDGNIIQVISNHKTILVSEDRLQSVQFEVIRGHLATSCTNHATCSNDNNQTNTNARYSEANTCNNSTISNDNITVGNNNGHGSDCNQNSHVKMSSNEINNLIVSPTNDAESSGDCNNDIQSTTATAAFGDQAFTGSRFLTLPDVLQCEWDACQTTMSSRKQLDAHIVAVHCDNEAKRCLWYNCKRKLGPFKKRCQLISHIRCHTYYKPYTCKFCQRSFRTNEMLKYHINTHTGEEPYQCFYCGSSFRTTGNRSTHISKVHPFLEIPQFEESLHHGRREYVV